MAHEVGTHLLCTCPPDTFDGAPDRQPCRDRAFPIDPHPVLSAEDLAELRERFLAQQGQPPRWIS